MFLLARCLTIPPDPSGVEWTRQPVSDRDRPFRDYHQLVSSPLLSAQPQFRDRLPPPDYEHEEKKSQHALFHIHRSDMLIHLDWKLVRTGRFPTGVSRPGGNMPGEPVSELPRRRFR